MITCPSGLVYNENAGICSWPDEAKREGCTSEGNIYFMSHYIYFVDLFTNITLWVAEYGNFANNCRLIWSDNRAIVGDLVVVL